MQVCRPKLLSFSVDFGRMMGVAIAVWGVLLTAQTVFAAPTPVGIPTPAAETSEISPASDSVSGPNYHLTGWLNTFVPGGGQALLGNYGVGGIQAVLEVGSFWWGSELSNGEIYSLDGFTAARPTRRLRRSEEANIEKPLYGDLLQEAGLKGHMVNTFDAYRAAARRRGGGHPGDERKFGIDDTPTLDLFLEPFQFKNLKDPFVYLPIALVAGTMLADYFIDIQDGYPTYSRLTPYSNSVFAFNYMFWQPVGSGAPEEMFFRGFLQNEILEIFPTPWVAIPLSTAAFTFAHAPGDGRFTAAIAGAYLGYLAHHFDGRLGRGITVHFWSGVLLGLETVLLNHKGQQTTPPATFSAQVNF